jgi:hypothetical protein
VILQHKPPVERPLTLDQWRELYYTKEVVQYDADDYQRADEPKFKELSGASDSDGRSYGLGDEELAAMGQIHIARDGTELRKIPLWMNNDRAIHQLLLLHFPKLVTDFNQRSTAAKWLFIIQRFRVMVSARQIAREWNAQPHEISEEERLLREIFHDQQPPPSHTLDAAQVRSTIQKILHVAAGRRTDGKVRGGRRGRPKKQPQVAA